MFKLNKISQLVTVTPDILIQDYERMLNEEGLTGGYRPIVGLRVPLSQCLEERIPNLYFLRYGGIETLVAGGTARTPKGNSFVMKTAPRAATGPDLKRLLVGSGTIAGHFTEVVFRVFPFPEHQVWGLALCDRVADAMGFLRQMMAHMIHPLFVKMADENDGSGILRSLNLPEEKKCVMAFNLAGIRRYVEAEKQALIKIAEGRKVNFYWPSRPTEIDVLNGTILIPEAHGDLLKECSSLLGGHVLKTKETKVEMQFVKFFGKS